MKIETKVRYGLAALLALPTVACAQVISGAIALSLAAQVHANERVDSPAGCAQCHVEAIPLSSRSPERWNPRAKIKWKETDSFSFAQGRVYVFERDWGEIRKFYLFDGRNEKTDRFFLPSNAEFNPHHVLD